MNRKSIEHKIENADLFQKKLVLWSQKFRNVAFFNSNNFSKKNNSKVSYHSYECIAAIGQLNEIQSSGDDGFSKLKEFHDNSKDWCFGFFTYEMKAFSENLISGNPDKLGFPDYFFFNPEYVFEVQYKKVKIHFSDINTSKEADLVFNEILDTKYTDGFSIEKPEIKNRTTKEEYLKNVGKIKDHIQAGDIYEMNYCQEFYSDGAEINPAKVYLKLEEISPTPFSCFMKIGDRYLLSASPERFLKKTGNRIISQPIKGTIRRGKNEEEDQQLKYSLYNNTKERSENVMITDLVRNDLSRTAAKGSVVVEELYGIYAFEQVFQMISTISSVLKSDVHFTECIRKAFPMGSMTGAPKIRAMELIEEFENVKRGLYSGSVGYIDPNGDFDFNVVIRSILYNAANKYLSFMVGSAITTKAIPEYEYDECLLKATAIMKSLGYE